MNSGNLETCVYEAEAYEANDRPRQIKPEQRICSIWKGAEFHEYCGKSLWSRSADLYRVGKVSAHSVPRVNEIARVRRAISADTAMGYRQALDEFVV